MSKEENGGNGKNGLVRISKRDMWILVAVMLGGTNVLDTFQIMSRTSVEPKEMHRLASEIDALQSKFLLVAEEVRAQDLEKTKQLARIEVGLASLRSETIEKIEAVRERAEIAIVRADSARVDAQTALRQTKQ